MYSLLTSYSPLTTHYSFTNIVAHIVSWATPNARSPLITFLYAKSDAPPVSTASISASESPGRPKVAWSYSSYSEVTGVKS